MSSPWNHGKIRRNEAEQLLVANGKNGAFLVRQSESVTDAHVLSLWFDGMVHHFRILKNENVFVVQASSGGSTRFFSTLEEVIELFKQPGQGLPHELREPIINDLNNVDSDLDHDTDEEQDPPDQDMISCEGFGENPEYTDIGSFFINKLEDMDTSGLDSDFRKNVRSYLNGGFERDGEKINANKPPTDLQELIVNSAESVQRELKHFLRKIMFLQQLLCASDDLKKLIPGVVGCGSSARQPNETYDDLVEDLARCVAGIKSLKMLAQKAHQEHGNSMKDEQSQTRTFEVTSCGNFKTKSYLKVDITEGNIWFMKNENDSIDDSTVVEHDKILQLVKDPDTPKLTFKIAKGNREYLFKDIQAREHLCQLTQHMMNIRDPTKKEPKQISIFVGTWNMGSASPRKIESWLKCNGTGATINDWKINEVVGHDIYAIGTQESSIGEATWISKIKMELKKQFKVDYYPVSTQSLWGIRLVILVKPEHKNRISRVEKSSVKTGIANTLGNKGGVGISFDFLSTSLCFINCHLTSGNEDLRKERRRQNYLDILKGLSLGHKNAYDLTNQFHHVFWFGDLNYRIDLPYEEIMPAIQAMDFKKLSSEDQLRKERDTGKVFVNFHETVPHFPPTYRYKRGTRDAYEHIKVKRAGNRINVPSWCDRVLWRSFPDLDVKQNSYGCTDDIVSSDHSPVFASFDVPIISQFVDSPASGRTNSQAAKPSCKINIPWIKVKVNTVSKTEFYLEFHSVCLATSVKSKTGKKAQPWDPPRAVNSKPTLTSYSEWTDTLFQELNPILDNPEYLREQHILIAVKSEAGDESYGECVVSLRGHIFNTPQTFNSDLTHGGIWSGELRGTMNVLNIKQAIHLRRPPPVHAKPDLISGQNAVSPKVPHRPVSCLTPNVRLGENIPPSRTSASLGRRQPPLIKRKSAGSVTTQADITKISTYIMLPNISSGTTSNNTGDDLKTMDSTVPPPLPAKAKKEPTVPSTVDQFLSKLGLSCYLQNLEDNGFEQLTFLDNISDEDLADSGIKDTSHVKLILDEVEYLRKVGVFNTE